MTPDEAIVKLRTLPEDQQRAVLGQLDEGTRSSILQKLSAPGTSSTAPSTSNTFIDTLGGNAPWQKAIDSAAQTGPVTGLKSVLNNLGAGAVRATLQPAAHPLKTIAGLFPGHFSGGTAAEIQAQQHAEQQPLPPQEVIAAIPAAAIAVAGAGKSGAPETVAPSEWAQAAAADKPWLRLASKVGPTGNSQKTLGVVPALADDLKSIVPQLGKTGARNPLEFSKAVDHFKATVAGPEYRNLADPLADKPLGSVINDPLPDNVVNFKLANGETIGRNPTIAESEAALREANQIAGPGYETAANVYDRQQVLQADSVAQELRARLNNRIGELSGIPPESVSMLRKRIGEAGNIAANAKERSIANTLGIDSAPSVAMKAGMARSMPARALRAALVEPMENWQFRHALDAAQNPGAGAGTVQLQNLMQLLRSPEMLAAASSVNQRR